MKRFLRLSLAVAVLGLGSLEETFAQSTGRGGSSTGGSSTGTRSTGTGSGSATRSTGTGTATGNVSSFGSGAAAQTQTGFVGRGNTGSFVGNQMAGQQSVSAGTTSRFSGFGGNFGAVTNQSTSQTRGGQMRVSQRVAVGVPPISAQAVQMSLQTQFTTLTNRLPHVTANVGPEGLVTLEGQVVDFDTAKLAEALTLLEPGVHRVQNNLVFPAAPAVSPVTP